PAAFHAGIDDVLLAGLLGAVCEWRRRRERPAGGLNVELEGHGRIPAADDLDLSRTVGWFTAQHPVRLDVGTLDFADVLAGGPEAGRLLGGVKDQLRAVPGDGLGYGLLRRLNPDTAPILADLPGPQLGFNYLGRFPATGGAAAADWQPAPEGGLSGGSDE